MRLREKAVQFVKNLVLPRNPKGRATVLSGPVVVAGMFSTANGIGEAARRLYEALSASCLDVRAVDTSFLLNQVDFECDLPLELMPTSHDGTVILVANPPEMPTLLFRLDMRVWKNWKIIGYW